ncbi:MAG TPA: 2-iminoacetate synthase ThiH [Fibrobacteres bacterium]|nr:2-iminoacetate synthase ThiH [Fibrobacterota bacterium]
MAVTFYDELSKYSSFDFGGYLESVTSLQVEDILGKDYLTEYDFLALLSEQATDYLEPMAVKANEIKQKHFGNTISVFTPIYISNYCENMCAYCSFSRMHKISRKHLSYDEIRQEAIRISESGIRHILALTGESHSLASIEFLEKSMHILSEYFPSVSIEIYPLMEKEYEMLVAAGVDGFTMFQEVYDETLYHKYHNGGPKDKYRFRLEAPDRACASGMRTVGIGALMGLGQPSIESFFTGIHANYLQKTYPEVEISISFPRIRPLAGTFIPPYTVDDVHFVQTITATRIFLNNVGITISTRESETFRNSLLPLGVTRMSAGVSTAVGAHSYMPSTTQFEIADCRSVDEMKSDLLHLGYQPVMQDWNSRFL